MDLNPNSISGLTHPEKRNVHQQYELPVTANMEYPYWLIPFPSPTQEIQYNPASPPFSPSNSPRVNTHDVDSTTTHAKRILQDKGKRLQELTHVKHDLNRAKEQLEQLTREFNSEFEKLKTVPQIKSENTALPKDFSEDEDTSTAPRTATNKHSARQHPIQTHDTSQSASTTQRCPTCTARNNDAKTYDHRQTTRQLTNLKDMVSALIDATAHNSHNIQELHMTIQDLFTQSRQPNTFNKRHNKPTHQRRLHTKNRNHENEPSKTIKRNRPHQNTARIAH